MSETSLAKRYKSALHAEPLTHTWRNSEGLFKWVTSKDEWKLTLKEQLQGVQQKDNKLQEVLTKMFDFLQCEEYVIRLANNITKSIFFFLTSLKLNYEKIFQQHFNHILVKFGCWITKLGLWPWIVKDFKLVSYE